VRLNFAVAPVALALAATAVGSAAASELRPFSAGSWQQVLRDHAGRPTIVHFWGLTCGPCRVELANWGQLLKERGNLQLVLIDADLVPNESSNVSTVLESAGLSTAENWIFDDAFAERLRYEVDPQWQGEIPYTVLIAADGSRKIISGVIDLNVLRKWLDEQAR
jgi:thiol-disulfide isomerase/thioredoxin